MKKNFLTKALSLAMCALMVAPVTACNLGGDTGEEVDNSKTQLNVFHYFAGFGDAWLLELADNFEKAYANVPFEDGKMGVQVHKRGEMRDFDATQMQSSTFDVFFLEGPKDFYNIMATGAAEPLDSIMTTPNAEDSNQTIISKMTAQQQAAYTYNGHYYGIPHYEGNYGLIYNRDMFEENGFFFAANPDEETGERFIASPTDEKTVGPDGKTGIIDGIDYSDDDGLPRTYEEFFYLCTEINARSIDPICWPGQYKQQHVVMLLDNVVSNNLGAEQANLRYTFNGEANNLIVLDESGNPVKNADGSFVTESMTINEGNAWNLARAKGVYDAFEFVQTILNNKDFYNEDAGENDGVSHTLNQQYFLENGSLGKRESAMLADGTWWQMEADAVFEDMEMRDENYSKENRKFGWLPLPQANEAEAAKLASGEKKLTFNDYLNAVSCVRSGLPEGVKKAALAFLQYAYTDKALTDFTYTTGTTIGVDYLDQIDRSKLNYYTASLINYLDKAEIVHQVSSTARFQKNQSNFIPTKIYGSGNYVDILEGTWTGKLSTLNYFKGHINAYKGIAW